MTSLHCDLQTAIDAVEIAPLSQFRVRTNYTISGSKAEFVAPKVSPYGTTRGDLHEDDLHPIVSALATELYFKLYVRPTELIFKAHDRLVERDFIAALSDANCGQGSWETGWRIVKECSDKVSVSRDGLAFWVRHKDVRFSEAGLVAGATCKVRIGKELRSLIPGFYLAIGNSESEVPVNEAKSVRLYWHLQSDGALHFMSALTAAFNRADIPFRAKVLSDPQAYRRADAGVLYIDKLHVLAAIAPITTTYATTARFLRHDVPFFTKCIAPGVGLADDPGNGLSFGQHRCRLVASSLCESVASGRGSREEISASLATAFVRAGLDPIHPYLEAHSIDSDYNFELHLTSIV